MRNFLIELLGGYIPEEHEALFSNYLNVTEDLKRATNTVRELEAVIAKLNKPKRKYVRKA